MKTFTKLAVLMIAIFAFGLSSWGQSYHALNGGPFTQNWSNTGLITTNNDWTGVPSIIGYRGDDITATTGVDPQTLLGEGTPVLNVLANQLNPNTTTAGGLAEFEIANPVVAFQGSGTADAPNIVIFLNTTGVSNIQVQYKLRDVDGSADNSIQPVALQYRVGTTGNFTNVPAGFVADASSGPSLASLETTVNVTLPASVENQSQVQVRIITSNAVGNDEFIGIDDISISGSTSAVPTLVATPSTLSGFTYTQGSGPSTSQSYNLSGTDLTGLPTNVVVTGSTNYEVSLDNTTFGANVNVPISSATLNSTPIYVRLKAGLLAGTYNNETITNAGGGASTNLTSSGSVAPSAPTITVGTLTAFANQIINTTSSEKSYTVSAINLTENLTITPPANFEISTGTGASFVATNPIILTPSSGTVASTIIYVRFTPTAVQAYAGNITHVSTGATTQNVAVSGNGIPVPPDLPFYDNFNYPDNSLLTANGWVAHSGGGTASVAVGASNGLSYAGYSGLSGLTGAIEGNAAKLVASGEDVSSVFAPVSTGSIYFSHLVNVTSATEGYYIHLGATSSVFAARIFVKPSTSGKFNFGLSNTSTASYAATPTDFDLNTTYLVIVKYDVSTTGDVSIWIKPTGVPSTELDAGTPEHTSTGTGQATIERVCLRQFSATQGITVDGVRVGTSWASILSGGTPAVLTVNGTLTDFGNQAMGTYSAEQTFTVAGTGLTENIIVTPPTGFEISTGTGVGFVATNPITLTPASGEVAETTIYVRFAPLAVQAYSGNITVATTGATTNNVAVAGNGVAGEPTNNATGFTAGITTTTTIPLSWTDATGAILPENYLIKGSSVGFANIVAPVDGTPEANAALVQNVAYGVEAYTFTGLTPNTTYYFKIYPYNGSGSTINYKTGTGTPEVSATTLADSKTLNVVVMLQGLFDPNTNENRQVQDADENSSWNKFSGNIADTLSVYLADANDPWNIIHSVNAVNVDVNGSCIVSLPGTISGNYYIVIKHRNSVETWSSNTIDFTNSNINYNFSTAAGQAFGNNLADLKGDGTIWGLYTGDVDGLIGKDEYVDGFDVASIFNKSTEGAFGFMPEDLTGDGYIDGFDVALVFNNSQIAVGQNTPPNPQ